MALRESSSRSWLFRVASSPSAGGGHVSRTHSLAAQLQAHAPVTFALDRGGERWRHRLEGFEVLVNPQPDASRKWVGILTDSYELEPEELENYRVQSCPLVGIVDSLDPWQGYDLVVNSCPGLAGDRLNGIPALLGATYALIDERFNQMGRDAANASVRRIGITFGLLDEENYCGAVVEALDLIETDAPISVVILIGGQSQRIDALKERACSSPHEIEVRVDEVDPAAVLASADIVVGAGGVSLLERMSMGIPSISSAIAENQRNIVEGAATAGATKEIPSSVASDPPALAGVVAAFIRDVDQRRKMVLRAKALVDGHGARRVAQALARLASNVPETS